VRAELDIAENEILVGLVGRLDRAKGHPVFLEAAAMLASERADVRFVCVGDGPGPYRNRLQRLGRQLGLTGRLIWAGARQDMPAIYSALDISCSPSYSEAFNNVLAEAMACGVPCVVTADGDPANMVGDTGVVVTPGDPQVLADGLRSMLHSLPTVEPDRLREHIARRFSVKKMVDATEKALLDVLNEKP
jgi:glycosyltransferase involved in cell wall biosynthesis